jgi:hypothetical protein
MKSILILYLVLFCANAFSEIKSVTVFDGNFQKISQLTQAEDINAFTLLWETKVASDKKIKMNWSEGYKLDISGGKDSGRWLYRGGRIMLLTKSALAGLYEIKNIQQFELLLRIPHNK